MAVKRNFIFYVNWKYIIIRIHMVYLYKLYVYIGNPPTHAVSICLPNSLTFSTKAYLAKGRSNTFSTFSKIGDDANAKTFSRQKLCY